MKFCESFPFKDKVIKPEFEVVEEEEEENVSMVSERSQMNWDNVDLENCADFMLPPGVRGQTFQDPCCNGGGGGRGR